MPAEGRLHLSRDRKVSPAGYHGGTYKAWNGTRRDRGFVASLENSFGLPAGKTCPGATEFCVSCYAVNAEQYRSAVRLAMQHNLDLLLACDDDPLAMAALLDEAVGRFVRAFNRTGLPDKDCVFRIHWDGDFFSLNYAAAWWLTMRKYPHVKFWAYTRSFTDECNVVPYLQESPNLTLFLSVDQHNADKAHQVAGEHPWVRLALCHDDYRSARGLGRDRPSRVCPENAGRLPLMNDQGRGACVECRWCIGGSSDIIFSTSHVEDLEYGQGRLFNGNAFTPPVTVPVAIRPRSKR